MKNIFLIPVKKPSRLYTNKYGNLKLGIIPAIQPIDAIGSNQYLYITSDDETKYDEWCFEVHNGDSKAIAPNFTDEKGNKWWLRKMNMNCSANDPECKKIILTNDQDLIADGVQAIDEKFLEWFIKNPDCEKIDVENSGPSFPAGIYFINYPSKEVIIPQEITKPTEISNGVIMPPEKLTTDEIVERYSDLLTEEQLEMLKNVAKPQEVIASKEDAEIFINTISDSPKPNEKLKQAFKSFTKQETLEEVAERLFPVSPQRRKLWLEGAQWQAERMYTKEQVLQIVADCDGSFEQAKKYLK